MPPTQTESQSRSSSSSSSSSNHNHLSNFGSNSLKLTDQPTEQLVEPATQAQQETKRKETVIVFDWDDTLLASSFLSGRGYRLDSDMSQATDLHAGLRELEDSVCGVLNLACTYGEVHIVTNAETGWVQLSAAKFIPKVVPLLSKVKVLSARSTFESMFPDSPLKWKFYAFQEKLSGLFVGSNAEIEKNILSFGDSHVEREAVRAVTRGVCNTKTKSVKFAERPSMEQLRRQIDLVTNCFAYIHNHQGDLDLQLTVTVNQTNSPQESTAQTPTPATSSSSSSPAPFAPRSTPNDMMEEEKSVAAAC